ncbi:MAG: hypothetical protein H6618_08745 [Deltaproteobacteria bacterium]|nr:hypothetical protein [Deltaproteobacteria bacterium]
MASVNKDSKRNRIQLTISASDIEKTWGPDVSLSLVKHWIELGRDRHNQSLKIEAQAEILAESIRQLEEEVRSLKTALSKSTELLLHTSKLVNLASTLSHYELEVLKARKKAGKLTEHEASKSLLAEIKEENFERFLSEEFPGKSADRFLATTTKSSG